MHIVLWQPFSLVMSQLSFSPHPFPLSHFFPPPSSPHKLILISRPAYRCLSSSPISLFCIIILPQAAQAMCPTTPTSDRPNNFSNRFPHFLRTARCYVTYRQEKKANGEDVRNRHSLLLYTKLFIIIACWGGGTEKALVFFFFFSFFPSLSCSILSVSTNFHLR